jgi:hypothetical protein
MNYQKACEVLFIHPNEISIEVIRKQYKYLALKYHPDKNSAPNAADVYREIKDAHDYLINGLNFNTYMESSFVSEEDGEDEENIGLTASTIYQKIKASSSYIQIAASFFETLYNNKTFQKQIFHPILMRILLGCEDKGIQLFEKLDKTHALKVLEILTQYQDLINISDDFLEKAHNILDLKTDIVEPVFYKVVLNPNIDDLYNQSVFKLRIDEKNTVLVPLWHSELIYENEKTIVECVPELPECVSLDEYNNIHVRLSYLLAEIWDTDIIEIDLGTKKIHVMTRELKMMRYQVIIRLKEGIPVPNDKNIFKTDKISNIYIHVLLDLHRGV